MRGNTIGERTAAMKKVETETEREEEIEILALGGTERINPLTGDTTSIGNTGMCVTYSIYIIINDILVQTLQL